MRSIFIKTKIDGSTQEEINEQFNDNFEIVKNLIQAPSVVKTLPPNEYGNVFVRAGVVMLTLVDTDYDNPDIEKCRKLVLDDFSNKILTIFKEKPYSMNYPTPHCNIYHEINKRWFEYNNTLSGCNESKKILKLINDGETNLISTYIQEYIKDYMEHNYIGRDIEIPTVKDIRSWCGGGEFPFLEVYLIRHCDNKTLLCYYLAR